MRCGTSVMSYRREEEELLRVVKGDTGSKRCPLGGSQSFQIGIGQEPVGANASGRDNPQTCRSDWEAFEANNEEMNTLKVRGKKSYKREWLTPGGKMTLKSKREHSIICFNPIDTDHPSKPKNDIIVLGAWGWEQGMKRVEVKGYERKSSLYLSQEEVSR